MRHIIIGGPAAIGLVLCLASVASAQAPTGDPELRQRLAETAGKVVFPERCGECHAAEFEVWEQTSHATGFGTLHTTARAKEVYRALGLRLIKRGTEETTPACLECHYTPEVRRDVVRAGAGVTCESCHGPARDWVGVHSDYDVAEPDFQRAAVLESADHRAQRVADSRAAGMRRPSDLYDVAANCFGCHTVPREELVNVAGHTTGSDFELVDWNERIRHNFLESYKTADGRTNAERPALWKRVTYVVGRALDVEYSLRGVAVATEDELYFAAMTDRAGAAIDELYYLNDTVAIPAVETIIDIFDGVELKPNNRGALLAAADEIETATRAFIAGSDGTQLAAVDHLWDPDAEPPAAGARTDQSSAPRGQRRVTELPLRTTDNPAGTARPDGGDPPATAVASTDGIRSTPGPVSDALERTSVGSPPPAPVPLYDVLRRPPWRASPEHDFVKVPCGKCHTQQQAWWQKDRHKGTAEPLRNGDDTAAQIAELYGIDPADMAKGDQTCMWCHGTVVAAPRRKVRPGVGCQRCHGAGADYLEPHETETYAQSVDKGLTDLHTPAVRATSCAGCHYITDPGLLAAGHDTGANFDIVDGMNEIQHWGAAFGRKTETDMTPAAVSSAYAAAIEDRGPPQEVERRQPVDQTSSSPTTTSTASETTLAGRGGPEEGSGQRSAGAVASKPITARSPRERSQPTRAHLAASRPAVVADPELAPMGVDPDASAEEALLQLKTRLEELYRTLGGAPGS